MAALMAHKLKHLIMLCIAFAFQDLIKKTMQLVHLYFLLVVTFSSITQLQCIISIEYCLLVHQICNLVPPLFADRGWAGIGKWGDCFVFFFFVKDGHSHGSMVPTVHLLFYYSTRFHCFWSIHTDIFWDSTFGCMWSSILCGVVLGLWSS